MSKGLTAPTGDALIEHWKECDCHDSWDQCPCGDGGHPIDGSCDCCPFGVGLCGPLPTLAAARQAGREEAWAEAADLADTVIVSWMGVPGLHPTAPEPHPAAIAAAGARRTLTVLRSRVSEAFAERGPIDNDQRQAGREEVVARVEALAEVPGYYDEHSCFKPWCPQCATRDTYRRHVAALRALVAEFRAPEARCSCVIGVCSEDGECCGSDECPTSEARP